MQARDVRLAWQKIVSGGCGGPVAGLVRATLHIASGLYAAGLAVNHWLYDSGCKPRTRPVLPVVSVGNLTLGGTGKTTTAAFLARLLSAHVTPGIVLRGYGGQSGQCPLIVSDGSCLRASLPEAGDEAVMLARLLPGCAVAVGKRRERTIQALRDKTPARIAILDDGFQYFRMARQADIVLLDALADPQSLRLFPAGYLREPLRNLRRANQVWITHADLAGQERVVALCELVAAHAPGCAVVTTRHRSSSLRLWPDNVASPAVVAGRRVLAVSALGNPIAFELSLVRLGAEVVPLRLPDHHAYRPDDWPMICTAAQHAGAELIVTTEKDAVKLPSPPAEAPAVAVLGCELEVIEGMPQVQRLISELLSAAETE